MYSFFYGEITRLNDRYITKIDRDELASFLNGKIWEKYRMSLTYFLVGNVAVIVKYNLRDNAADSSWNMEHSQRLLA